MWNGQVRGWQGRLSQVVQSSVPLLFLEALRFAMGAPFSVSALPALWLFVVVLLASARWGLPYPLDSVHWKWPWAGIGFAGIGVLAWIAYASTAATIAAWIALASLYILLLDLDVVLANGQAAFLRWGIHILLALTAGAIPVIAAQLESSFAEEEFFVALQALELATFWFVLWIIWRMLWRAEPVPRRSGIRLNAHWLEILLIPLGLIGLFSTVSAYQHSFYPPEAPQYNGVSATTPFVCGRAASEAQTYDGVQVFQRLLARVEDNPHKAAPEYGMLALGKGENGWAQLFRSSLLNEAAQGLYTGPANSLKSVQYEAALRAYYFAQVRQAFPALFSPDDEKTIRQWFAVINRRALTVEWVDWMYALAFAQWPEGPYANQENGAGLLAVLESTGLTTPELSPVNRSYLERIPRGWSVRFRNTDDAIVYQPEWISNAYFQSLYTDEIPQRNLQLAFEWLLMQALPNGATLGYNHPETIPLAGIAYLGAGRLGDAHYIWLSGKSLDNLESRGEYLSAQPGVERPVSLIGNAPTLGSCLIYGDSGLPNQAGPLAPDKIVFRDGWSDDAAYLLMNLRFTGWHRYKATNTVILLYKGTPLTGEILDGKPFSWLPEGRSLFRDKRVPRENLDGLIIERTGLSAVLYQLTGMGGPWAQDPPYYAQVEHFETGISMDTSTTMLEGWRGWRHIRTIYFYHRGPVVIVDDAEGPSGNQAALIWHLTGDLQDRQVRLGSGGNPVEMIPLPMDVEKTSIESVRDSDNIGNIQLTYASAKGRIKSATIFLAGDWVGARTSIIQNDGQSVLSISNGSNHIAVPLYTSLEAK